MQYNKQSKGLKRFKTQTRTGLPEIYAHLDTSGITFLDCLGVPYSNRKRIFSCVHISLQDIFCEMDFLKKTYQGISPRVGFKNFW